MENNNISNKKTNQHEDFISIQEIFYLCINKWYWFIISLFIIMGIATIYLLTTPPMYTRSAELLIKEDSKGNSLSGGMDQTFADMGLFKANTNVNNEILAIQSIDNIYEVVKRLHLNISYFSDGRFHRKVAYGTTLPITISFIDIPDNSSCNFTLHIEEDGIYKLLDIEMDEKEIKTEEDITGILSDTVNTPLGRVIVSPTPYFEIGVNTTLYVSRIPCHIATKDYNEELKVGLKDEKSTVVSLSIKDVCPQRGDDILNTVIAVYNENWVRDKNQIAVSTSMFINDRLNVIERELGNVDEDISSFKSEHLLPDVQAASNLYMQQSSLTNAQILELNNQLYMTKYIRGYLTDKSNKHQLLPANSGLESSNIETQITEYNTKLLQRNGLVANSSEKNPLVVDMDMALESMREAIISSIDNQVRTLNEQIRSLQQSEKQTTSKIAANPNQAKYLLSVERQQKVKEALYLFLLQKREENELSQAFTAYNTRIITKPYGSELPTSPIKAIILLIAFILSIIIPVLIIFIKHKLNTKVRGKKDLEGISVPFIGEIPLYFKTKKRIIKRKTEEPSGRIVVKEGNRDIINEAFRVLRTNLEFITEKEGKSNVIIITSFNPNSGKSFITMNTAVSLAIKQKRILVIDGDMRNATASEYINQPRIGLSNYLAGKTDNINDIIFTHNTHETLNVIPVGTIPPNPTELLFADRFTELINFARQYYDYVFIDCPPIEIVADTQIIEKVADRTIFVLRAGLLERNMLSELQTIYDEKRFKNMSVILNGTEGGSGGKYGYKYGYRYGYNYGYGSGYHYGSDNLKKNE